MWLACGIWVKELTGSNGAAGLTFLFFTAPALLAPLAGLLADRLPRRRLLAAANLAGAAILLPLLAVRGPDQVGLIYAVMFLYGCLNLVFAPAQSALLVNLLPEELLADANALLRTIRESLRLLAPLAGAGLYALLGGVAVAVLDMVTFVAAAALLLFLRVPDPAPDRAVRAGGFLRHWSGEATAGFRHLTGHPVLRRVVLASVLLALVLGFAESTVYAVVDHGLGRPPEFLGVLQAAQGLGAVLGGLGSAAAVRRFGEIRVAAVAFLCWAVGAALAAAPVLGVVLAARVCSGAGLTAWRSPCSPSCNAARPHSSRAGCTPASRWPPPFPRPRRSGSGRTSSGCSTTAHSSSPRPRWWCWRRCCCCGPSGSRRLTARVRRWSGRTGPGRRPGRRGMMGDMTTAPGPAPVVQHGPRHPLDPEPTRSTKARAVFALGLIGALTGLFVGGVVPSTMASNSPGRPVGRRTPRVAT